MGNEYDDVNAYYDNPEGIQPAGNFDSGVGIDITDSGVHEDREFMVNFYGSLKQLSDNTQLAIWKPRESSLFGTRDVVYKDGCSIISHKQNANDIIMLEAEIQGFQNTLPVDVSLDFLGMEGNSHGCGKKACNFVIPAETMQWHSLPHPQRFFIGNSFLQSELMKEYGAVTEDSISEGIVDFEDHKLVHKNSVVAHYLAKPHCKRLYGINLQTMKKIRNSYFITSEVVSDVQNRILDSVQNRNPAVKAVEWHGTITRDDGLKWLEPTPQSLQSICSNSTGAVVDITGIPGIVKAKIVVKYARLEK